MRHYLSACLILALCGVTLHQQLVLTKTEGENITISCRFPTAVGLPKYFCRNPCSTYLIRTDDSYAEYGRYSIEQGGFLGEFHVTIRQLRKSDTETYRCAVDRTGIDAYVEILIRVLDDGATSKPSTETAQRTILYVVVGLVAIISLITLAIVIFKKRTTQVLDSRTRGEPRTSNSQELATNVNCRPVSESYQKLDAATIEHNIYSTIPPTHCRAPPVSKN